MPPDRSQKTDSSPLAGRFDRSIPPTQTVETHELRDFDVTVQVGGVRLRLSRGCGADSVA